MPSSKTDYLILIAVAVAAYLLGANSNSNNTISIGSLMDGTGDEYRTDAATGIAFSNTKRFKKVARWPLHLIGVGTRKLAILNIYSLGFFACDKIQKDIEKNNHNDACQIILESTSPKAIQLTFSMGVGPEKIAEAVSQLSAVKKDIRQEFHNMIVNGMGDGKMQKGESMTFEWKGVDTIIVTARGVLLGTMKDKALAQGVLALYVGPKSVSPSLRHDLGC
jgi:hypothetical protein